MTKSKKAIDSPKRFIAVAGNLGVGKTTLVEYLQRHYGFEPVYEPYIDNPYLDDFYQDMKSWAFHSQLYFLAHKFRLHLNLNDTPGTVVQDRTIYEDAEIFAENLFRQGRLTGRDYRTYRDMYEALVQFLPPPDLVIYLKASVPTLKERILHRGREYEQEIPEEYLQQLNQLYNEWIDRFTLCPILTLPADDLDFVQYSEHMDLIVERVLDRLQGKEEVIFD